MRSLLEQKKASYVYYYKTTIKNDSYCEMIGNEELDPKSQNKQYLINCKFIGDSPHECLTKLYKNYGKIIQDHNIKPAEISDNTVILRIDKAICTKYEKMFINKE